MAGITNQRIAQSRIPLERIAYARPDQGAVYQFPPGSYTFTPPKAGFWKFVAWGAGGTGAGVSNAAGSGAYAELTTFLSPADGVALVVGASPDSATPGGTTTITLRSGRVVTCTGGVPDTGSLSAGGVATGGDVNLNGSLAAVAGLGTGGGTASAGGGAPANLPFRGGNGGVSTGPATSPGGGGGLGSASHSAMGGGGLVLAFFVRD